jgi:hypothetical protein
VNHLGDTNKMVGEDHIRDATKMVSDTPRTDAKRGFHDLDTAVAGDRMRLFCADPDDCFAWDKAKEAKL